MTSHASGFVPPPLSDGDVHVWCVEVPRDEAVCHGLLEHLSQSERQQAARYRFDALQSRPPVAGEKFRMNPFRSQGPPPMRTAVVWQPTMSDTFHVPEKFGLLRLIEATAR